MEAVRICEVRETVAMVKDLEFFVATIRNKYADFRSFVLNFRKI
jgi:hypothetical protein